MRDIGWLPFKDLIFSSFLFLITILKATGNGLIHQGGFAPPGARAGYGRGTVAKSGGNQLDKIYLFAYQNSLLSKTAKLNKFRNFIAVGEDNMAVI